MLIGSIFIGNMKNKLNEFNDELALTTVELNEIEELYLKKKVN